MQLVKNLPANAGDKRDTSSIPGLGRYPGEGNDNLFCVFCLGNPMDRGAWWATAHGVTKSQTQLSHFSFFLSFFLFFLSSFYRKRQDKCHTASHSDLRAQPHSMPGSRPKGRGNMVLQGNGDQVESLECQLFFFVFHCVFPL